MVSVEFNNSLHLCFTNYPIVKVMLEVVDNPGTAEANGLMPVASKKGPGHFGIDLN